MEELRHCVKSGAAACGKDAAACLPSSELFLAIPRPFTDPDQPGEKDFVTCLFMHRGTSDIKHYGCLWDQWQFVCECVCMCVYVCVC